MHDLQWHVRYWNACLRLWETSSVALPVESFCHLGSIFDKEEYLCRKVDFSSVVNYQLNSEFWESDVHDKTSKLLFWANINQYSMDRGEISYPEYPVIYHDHDIQWSETLYETSLHRIPSRHSVANPKRPCCSAISHACCQAIPCLINISKTVRKPVFFIFQELQSSAQDITAKELSPCAANNCASATFAEASEARLLKMTRRLAEAEAEQAQVSLGLSNSRTGQCMAAARSWKGTDFVKMLAGNAFRLEIANQVSQARTACSEESLGDEILNTSNQFIQWCEEHLHHKPSAATRGNSGLTYLSPGNRNAQRYW